MGHLILIRHSMPQIVKAEPSRNWELSPEGEQRAYTLGAAVAAMKPASVHSSAEQKAMQTAEFITRMTGGTLNIDPGFNEHERSDEPFGTAEEFSQIVSEALRSPGELIYGSETVADAVERFQSALGDAERYSASGDMAVVSHGTVIAAYLASRTGEDPVELWTNLGLPGLIVTNWPDPKQIELRQNFE